MVLDFNERFTFLSCRKPLIFKTTIWIATTMHSYFQYIPTFNLIFWLLIEWCVNEMVRKFRSSATRWAQKWNWWCGRFKIKWYISEIENDNCHWKSVFDMKTRKFLMKLARLINPNNGKWKKFCAENILVHGRILK